MRNDGLGHSMTAAAAAAEGIATRETGDRKNDLLSVSWHTVSRPCGTCGLARQARTRQVQADRVCVRSRACVYRRQRRDDGLRCARTTDARAGTAERFLVKLRLALRVRHSLRRRRRRGRRLPRRTCGWPVRRSRSPALRRTAAARPPTSGTRAHSRAAQATGSDTPPSLSAFFRRPPSPHTHSQSTTDTGTCERRLSVFSTLLSWLLLLFIEYRVANTPVPRDRIGMMHRSRART